MELNKSLEIFTLRDDQVKNFSAPDLIAKTLDNIVVDLQASSIAHGKRSIWTYNNKRVAKSFTKSRAQDKGLILFGQAGTAITATSNIKWGRQQQTTASSTGSVDGTPP